MPGARFVHTAPPDNITGHWTGIDHPLSNGNPNALLLVTQNYNPGGGAGAYNDRAIGVWYRSGAKKWAIINQTITGIPTGASFDVVVIPRYKVYMPLVARGS